MKFAEKNDSGIELHLDLEECELLYNALRHYSAYGITNKRAIHKAYKILYERGEKNAR